MLEYSRVAEPLPSTHEGLGLILSTTKERETGVGLEDNNTARAKGHSSVTRWIFYSMGEAPGQKPRGGG